MFRQKNSLEVTSIRHGNDIKNPRGELIDILLILKIKYTWSYPRQIDEGVSIGYCFDLA